MQKQFKGKKEKKRKKDLNWDQMIFQSRSQIPYKEIVREIYMRLPLQEIENEGMKSCIYFETLSFDVLYVLCRKFEN